MKTLQCIYDLAVSPCSYDFFAFLLSAETHRVRNRYDNIELIFLPGPNNGYREDNLRTDSQNQQFFINVIIPGIELLPSINSFHKLSKRSQYCNIKSKNNDIFPRGYSLERPRPDYAMHGLVTARIRDEEPVFFSPPEYAVQAAKKILFNLCNNKKPVILTVRELERENSSGMRSIKTDIWKQVIEELKDSDYELIVIRDTGSAVNSTPLFENIHELQVASYHMHIRYAIHQVAHLSFFKNNGPFLPAFYSKSNVIMFNDFDENHAALTEDWMKTNFGINYGSQYPMAAQNSIVRWGDENKEQILKDIFNVNTQLKTKANKWPFENRHDIALSVQTSFNYTLRNMFSGAQVEDLNVFSKLKSYIASGIIKPMNIKETLLSLENKNRLPKSTVAKLVELDNLFETRVFQ